MSAIGPIRRARKPVFRGPRFTRRSLGQRLISGTALVSYLSALFPVHTLWAQEQQEPYQTESSPSASTEYSADSRTALEQRLAGTTGPGGSKQSSGPETVDVPAANVVVGSGDPTSVAALSPQAISLPSGAATIGGMGESFTAQLSTGVSTFTVPFQTPAGRLGLTPSVSIVYSSSAGHGLAGVGWGLSGSMAIARQTDRGVPGYDDRDDWHPEQDRFSLGGQELVPICKVQAGQCQGALAEEVMPSWANGWQYFRARIEGAFLRFFWSPDHLTWRIQSKSGMNFELGLPLDGSGSTEALERNPDNESEVYRWHVIRQYDSHGAPDAVPPAPNNLVQYRYFHDGNAAYLADVYYTPPAGNPGTSDLEQYAYHIALQYDQRPDLGTSYRSGWLMAQRARLASLDVTSKPSAGGTSAPRELVRRYHLEYEAELHNSVLRAVAMEGRCALPVVEVDGALPAETTCPRLPPVTFEYERVAGTGSPALDAQGLAFERLARDVRIAGDSPPHSLGSGTSMSGLIDVNSDGLPDVVVTNPVQFNGNHGVYFNRGEVNGQLQFEPPVEMPVVGVDGVDANVLKLSNSNVTLLDLDGNATADFVHMPKVKRYSIFEPQAQGSGWVWQGREIETASGQDVKINFAQDAPRTAVMDVDGDGLVDIVRASATEYQTFFSLGRFPGGDGQFGHASWAGPESADISNDPVTACTPWSAAAVRLGDSDVRVAEMNGDGLPDIVRFRSGQVMYWPGRGNGTWGTGSRDDCPSGVVQDERQVLMGNSPDFGTVGSGGVQLADVNGDGLSDVVEVRADAVDIYMNDGGEGFTDRAILDDVPVLPTTASFVRLTDINGSGSTDIVWGQGYDYRYVDLTGGIRPYLLTKVHNGIGKTTELEYQSSTQLMVDAREAGEPWEAIMPLSTPVVVSSTVRDNLEQVGLPAGVYTTEYGYRDAVFDGRQREFRGFRTATTRQPGDAASPTASIRSTHLLGECQVAQNGFDVCAPADRWRDNWSEPLKGLQVLTESFDEQDTYLATAHTHYELRQLYTGRDGRRVTMALPKGQDTYRYDTAAFDGVESQVALPEVETHLLGIEETRSRSVTKRAAAGTVRIRGASVYDDFGHAVTSTAFGCVEGCGSVDEAITTHSLTERVSGDTSGWLFRATSSYVTGSVQPDERKRTRHQFNARGDLTHSFATLSGTLPLDRFHESGSAVAPTPPGASGGISSAVEIQTASYTHDAFGNLVKTRGALGRCRSVVRDEDYADLPVIETAFAGDIGADGCGDREFVTYASIDRGLEVLTSVVDVAGQPASFSYDGFGRLVAKTHVNPDEPGVLSSVPAETYEYLLPEDATEAPYTIVVARGQDGASSEEDDYFERYGYADGLGRPMVSLSEADPGAGDGGAFVVSGRSAYTQKGQPFRAYESHFWTGNPLAFPLGAVPPLRATSQLYDSFGRVIHAYGADGRLDAVTVQHALTVDSWDAEDLSPGQHAGSYATARSDGHGRSVALTTRVRRNGVLEERLMLSEYLPTGETLRVTQRRVGSPDVVRWMRYDSQGRMVLNVEPNTSVGFDPNPSSNPSTFKAWRYAYNDLGELVGTSDARGCGVNYWRDAGGRPVAADYSPCLAHHPAYSVPNFASESGIESLYRYDTPDPESGSIVDAAGRTLTVSAVLSWGRLTSVSDLGSKRVTSYDARGRPTGSAVKVVRPGTPAVSVGQRYAPRWYIQEAVFDAASRPVETSSGATSLELMGNDGQSMVRTTYTKRGLVAQTTSSYGVLMANQIIDANGLPDTITFGDGASTRRSFSYDERDRVRSAQTYRGTPALWSNAQYASPDALEPTQQLLLEDNDFEYDWVGNPTQITDWRSSEDWPASAKPVTRKFEYDDLYRLTRATYHYPEGTDVWKSPFAAENADLETVDGEARPGPHVSLANRVLEHRYEYDHLGNMSKTTDDASAFFDRSLGHTEHGAATAGPHRLQNASNRALAPSSSRKGDLDVGYDAGGSVTDLIVRRDGPCLPAGSSCWQRYRYDWDELGQISRARRWDLTAASPNERATNGEINTALPARAPDVDLRYQYAGTTRVLKTAVADGAERHTVYVFGGLELRRAAYEGVGSGADYELNASTESVLLFGGVGARVVYSEEDLPTLTSGTRHVFLLLGDYIGSNTFVIDHETGELVEHATYTAYGSTESNYRPERWGSAREPYKFSGKEEDVEVGLTYFGARYLSTNLNMWMSTDPVTIHELGSDPNPYAYVHGRPLAAIDPDGRDPISLGTIIIGAIIGAVIGAASSAAVYSIGVAVTGGEWDVGEFFKSMAMGALTGAVGGFAGGAATGLLGGGISIGSGQVAGLGWSSGAGIGAVAGAAGSLAAGGVGMLAAGNFDLGSLLLSAGLGALSGGIFGHLRSVAQANANASRATGMAAGREGHAASNATSGQWAGGGGAASYVSKVGTGHEDWFIAMMESDVDDLPGFTPMFDSQTEANIASLKADLHAPVREHIFNLRQAGIDARITRGSESAAGQQARYLQGRHPDYPGPIVTNAPGGTSAHNFDVGYDITIFENGKQLDHSPLYSTAGPAALSERSGVGPIIWGHDVPDFPRWDLAHYHSTAWQQAKDAAQGAMSR